MTDQDGNVYKTIVIYCCPVKIKNINIIIVI